MLHCGRRLLTTAAYKDVIIMGASRTPVGSFRGALKSKTAPALGSVAIAGALQRSGLGAGSVTEVIMGNVLSAGIGQAPARQAALQSGIDPSAVCTTVNKVCASGLKAVMLGAQSILLSPSPQEHVVVAGGMESMSNAPFYLPNKARGGLVYGNAPIIDSILFDGLTCGKHGIHMGEAAERTAEKFSISREMQDQYAIRSYERAKAAWEAGKFTAEISPVPIDTGRNPKNGSESVVVEDEEYKKADFSKFSNLKPAFLKEGGTITAANASTLNDGASAVVMVHSASPFATNLSCNDTVKGRILGIADAECDPIYFTTAPSLAIPKALKMANLTVNDIDLWEINEAFSIVVLANIHLLKLDENKVNVVGGGVSLGHPIGSSGCRLLVTLLHQLQKGQKGCVAICNGGGGASALVVERL